MAFVKYSANSSYDIVSSRDLQASHSRDRAGGATVDHVSFLCFWRLPLHPERCCDRLGIFSAEVSRCLLGRLLHGEVDRVSRTASVDSPTSKSVPSAPRESLNLRNAAFNSQGITFPCRLHARRWIVIMHAIISPGAKATSVSGSCTQTCAHLRTCSEGLVSRG